MLAVGRRAEDTFVASAVLTGITFFVVGYVRGHVVERRPWAAGLETLMIGGAAASVAYAVGKLLDRWVV
jgi:VIT1/CCC1 family predicted Fe2+/Mn2+ transporter